LIDTPIITIDPFKLAEWKGWGYGVFKQAIFRLPAGTSITLTLDVPETEVWWITYSIVGDTRDNPLDTKINLEIELFTRIGTIHEYHPAVNLHEGWIGEPLCPPGWHKAEGKGSIRMVVTNVTGNTSYTDVAEEEVFVHTTLLIFRIDRDKAELLDKLIDRMLEKLI